MYACIVFMANGEVKRWKYVRDLKSFSNFLDKSHSGWKYFNVYEKGTKNYLKRFYKGNLVPKLLSLILLLGLNLLTQKFTFNNSFAFNQPYENTFNKTTFNLTFIYDFNNSATIQTAQNQKGGSAC
jgi:hypothetical protein